MNFFICRIDDNRIMAKDKSKCLAETENYSEEDAKFMMMAIKLSEDNIDSGADLSEP